MSFLIAYTSGYWARDQERAPTATVLSPGGTAHLHPGAGAWPPRGGPLGAV